MKQILLTGLAAALTVTAVGKLSPSDASQEQSPVDDPEGSSLAQAAKEPVSFTKTAVDDAQAATQPAKTQVSQAQTVKVQRLTAPSKAAPAKAQSEAQRSGVASAVKIGERQSSVVKAAPDPAIATIRVHQQNGRQAATIYVRSIPVVTMLGAELSAAKNTGVKVATVDSYVGAVTNSSITNSSAKLSAKASQKELSDPIWRATTIAGKLNQLSQAGLKAQNIKVVWNGKRNSYMVRADDQHLLEVSEGSTVLPKSTKDTAQDALQITNRLRYQLGYAAPLKEVEGMPKPVARDSQVIAVGPVRFQIQGMASWYGPGFDGAYTASGERFNQYDLTAAHRYLPFGTKVRVTNLDNGRSVVVRITDRGPFVGDRVLDLSRGAAQIIGTVSSGVSPVRLDVLQ
jgi:rare lipoprotein A